MLFPPRVPDGARKDTAENGLKSGATGAYESLGNIRVSCMVKGTLRVWIDDRKKTLFAGDTFLLNAHEEAQMTALDDCFYYSVEIDKDKLFDRLCIPALTVFENFVLQDASVACICRKMNDEYRSQGPFATICSTRLPMNSSSISTAIITAETPSRRPHCFSASIALPVLRLIIFTKTA